MAVLTVEEIDDMVLGTQKDLGRFRWTEIATDIQQHWALPRILKKKKVQFKSGLSIKRQMMVKQGGQAKHVGLNQVDNTNRVDIMDDVNIPWRNTQTDWQVDRREIAMNSGASEIYDIVKIQRSGAMISLAELLEETLWSKPATSADKLTPFGVLYWIVKNATEGFYGGDPAGFAAGAGGLAVADVPRWRNYTAQYVNITKADLIAKMRPAYRKIQFRSPINMPNYKHGNDNYGIYTTDTVYTAMEALVEGQNENMGDDIASKAPKFKGLPVHWVPYLDADATNPVYFINWSVFYPYFLKGFYMKQSKMKEMPLQHNSLISFVDMTWNFLCVNRRLQAVLSQ